MTTIQTEVISRSKSGVEKLLDTDRAFHRHLRQCRSVDRNGRHCGKCGNLLEGAGVSPSFDCPEGVDDFTFCDLRKAHLPPSDVNAMLCQYWIPESERNDDEDIPF